MNGLLRCAAPMGALAYFCLLVLCDVNTAVVAFSPTTTVRLQNGMVLTSTTRCNQHQRIDSITLSMTSKKSKQNKKGKKGFGSAEPSTDDSSSNTITEVAKAPSPQTQMASMPQLQRPSKEKNAGQQALADMRRNKAEEKDRELRQVRELLQTEEAIKKGDTSPAIPERVAQRMGKRMLPFVGIPLIGGMGAFVTFWYLATYKDLEFQPVLVAGSTIAILVFGLLVRETCAELLFSLSLYLVSFHFRSINFYVFSYPVSLPSFRRPTLLLLLLSFS